LQTRLFKLLCKRCKRLLDLCSIAVPRAWNMLPAVIRGVC